MLSTKRRYWSSDSRTVASPSARSGVSVNSTRMAAVPIPVKAVKATEARKSRQRGVSWKKPRSPQPKEM